MNFIIYERIDALQKSYSLQAACMGQRRKRIAGKKKNGEQLELRSLVYCQKKEAERNHRRRRIIRIDIVFDLQELQQMIREDDVFFKERL